MEGVSYGHQYKYYCTIRGRTARSIQRYAQQIARTLVLRFEDRFAGG